MKNNTLSKNRSDFSFWK